MKRLITSAILVTASVVSVFAQQDAQFSQNMFGKLNYNPGYAGMDKAYCMSLIARDQWAGYQGGGNPETFLFNGDAYIPQIGGGAGLTVYSDKLGFVSTTEIKLSYSYHLVLGNGVLGIGPDIGLLQTSSNGAYLAPDMEGATSSGGNGNMNDPLIPWGGSSGSTYDIGLGAYYATPQGLYVGLSTSHLPAQQISGTGTFQWDVARHYYLMGGYTYNASPDWDIKPDLYIESDASSSQYQLDCLAEYRKLIWFGLGYRLDDAAIIFVGVNYAFKNSRSNSNLKIGYSYDLTTSQIKSVSDGSHELMIQFCFRPPIVTHTNYHENVRYLR